jgi:hypothetical protein
MGSSITLPQLQAMSDALLQAIGNAVLSVRYPDGRTVTFRTMKDLLDAKSAIDDAIRTYGGASASKSTLGQTRRGDGPTGPGFPGPQWGWD